MHGTIGAYMVKYFLLILVVGYWHFLLNFFQLFKIKIHTKLSVAAKEWKKNGEND